MIMIEFGIVEIEFLFGIIIDKISKIVYKLLMKVIIAGGRKFKPDTESGGWLFNILNELNPDEIISGCAEGADKFGEDVASVIHICVKRFPANWREYGKAAGPIRNQQMADYADACILFPGDKGTSDMRKRAIEKGMPVYEYLGYGTPDKSWNE